MRALESALTQTRRRRRHEAHRIGLSGRHDGDPGLRAGRRPYSMVDTVYQPTRQFCDHLLKRFGVEMNITTRCRVPASRNCSAPTPASSTSKARLSNVRNAGHSGHRGRRARKEHLGSRRQHVGEPPLLPTAGSRAPMSLSKPVPSISSACGRTVGFHHIQRTRQAPRRTGRRKSRRLPGSEETYLGLRGLRTLDVRLARHQETGMRLAQWLKAVPKWPACCIRRCR